MRLRLAAVTLGVTAVVTSACGGHGGHSEAEAPAAAERTVEVSMVDIGFEPGRLEVEAGETVRFVFTNRGKLAHDAFIGAAPEQAEHEEMMQAGDGGHGHGGGAAVTVEPGGQAELVRTFSDAGSLEIGCHQPGHYGAGMRLPIDVDEA